MSFKNLSLKWIGFGFAGYIASTVITTILAMSIWVATQDSVGKTQQQLSEMAETDPILILWSAVISIISMFFFSALITRKTANVNIVNGIGLALCLTAYGAISIVMHPEHHWWQQLAKLLLPVIICWLGAKYSLRKNTSLKAIVGKRTTTD
jgi:hypothetical protein